MNLETVVLSACFMGWASIFKQPTTADPGSSCNSPFLLLDGRIKCSRDESLARGESNLQHANGVQDACPVWQLQQLPAAQINACEGIGESLSSKR